MEFIAKPYYVGLLSAAALYGVAHQQPQEFFIITTTKQLATQKKGIPVKFLDNRKTEIDIDLVQKKAGPIRNIITGLRTVLAFLGEPKVKQKTNNNTLIFRFDSQNVTSVPLRLKVEVNCREHILY